MEQKKFNINNIFYGVIGVATLMLAIMGATFAYYTATANNATTITGNMATIGVDVEVTKMTKVDETKGGLIPMSNNMVEMALNKAGTDICVDDNGNAVCQVYKVSVNNESTSSMFVDVYVTLSGGSGVPADVVPTAGKMNVTRTGGTVEEVNVTREWANVAAGSETTMRWAQAFCSTEEGGVVTACTTTGKSTVRGMSDVTLAQIGVSAAAKNDGRNRAEIYLGATSTNTDTDLVAQQLATPLYDVTGTVAINKAGNVYEIIDKNYIRISDHTLDSYKYNREADKTSALVFNQYLSANPTLTTTHQSGTSSTTTFTYSQTYYIVVWLSENGYNQTAGSDNTNVPAADKKNGFFKGNATVITAEGNEVTATFSGTTRVEPDTPIQ